MSNLFYGEIKTNGEYVTLASKTNLTFTNGTTYIIENRSGKKIYVYEGSSAPSNDAGFVLKNGERLVYTASDSNLYFKTKSSIINVAN